MYCTEIKQRPDCNTYDRFQSLFIECKQNSVNTQTKCTKSLSLTLTQRGPCRHVGSHSDATLVSRGLLLLLVTGKSQSFHIFLHCTAPISTWLTWSSPESQNLSVQCLLLWYSLVVHQYHTTKPVQSSISDCVLYLLLSSSHSDFFICYLQCWVVTCYK